MREKKSSQGVSIEKAVFTGSKHNNFIFSLPGRNPKAAKCRAARPAGQSAPSGLVSPQQAESTAPGIAGDRAFEALYYKDTACKRLKNIFKVFLALFHKQCQHIYVNYNCLLGQRPRPFDQPLLGLATHSETERYELYHRLEINNLNL